MHNKLPVRLESWPGQARLPVHADDRAYREGAPPPVTLREVLQTYIHRCRRRKCSPATIRVYERSIYMHCADWLDVPLAAVGQARGEVLARHLDLTRRAGPFAANQAIQTFRTLYRYAQRFYPNLPPCPTTVVDYHPEPPRQEVIEDWGDWWRRTDRLQNPVARDWYRFLLFTGMRRSAAQSVAVADIRLEQGFIFVPCPKGGEARAFDLPLSDILIAVVRRRLAENAELYPNTPWLFPSYLSTPGHLVGNLAVGLPSPHVHRHSFASAAKAAGLADYDIKLLLNHKIADVTGRYIHRSMLGDHLRDCQNRVSRWLLARIREDEPNALPDVARSEAV